MTYSLKWREYIVERFWADLLELFLDFGLYVIIKVDNYT